MKLKTKDSETSAHLRRGKECRVTKDEVLKQDTNELIYELKKIKVIETIDKNKFLT